MNDDDDFLYKRAEHAERQERLSAARDPRRADYNPKHSAFIRRMRLILPLIAAIIMAVVFAWGNMSDDNIIPAESPQAPKTIGKNELLNPRFESVDEKAQPYTITATRALQGSDNEDMVMLEEPLADMLLTSGNWIAVKAQQGTFLQKTQKLVLEGDVEMFHDQGYQMEMAELHVDLGSNIAWSETDIYGQGPAGTLNAKGLKADNTQGNLIFTGPAKLILHKTGGTDLGRIFDE